MAPHITALVHLAVLVACVLPSGVWSHVTSHDVAFRIDSVAFGEGRTRDWVINGDELPSSQDKPVLLSALIVIETDDVSFRVYARDPRECGIGNVNRRELSVGHPEAVE